MKYFSYLSDTESTRLFSRPPQSFSCATQRDILRDAVGGLLYTPATNPSIAQMILSDKVRGLSSLAICLEDSVQDSELSACKKNLARQLTLLSAALADGTLPADRLPLLFVRVRCGTMLEDLSDLLIRHRTVLTGIILPKATAANLEHSLSLVADLNRRSAVPIYAMPILESEELVLSPSRIAYLLSVKAITDRYFSLILNIRVGATDLSGLYGIRRNMDTPIYSISPVAGCLGDIIRVFALEDRYTVSGPVWEYYSSPAAQPEVRTAALAGLLREIALDRQNGFTGKTCVHPSQLLSVQALHTVPFETYRDAEQILAGDSLGGVLAGSGHSRMNERKPHTLWARKILRQAALYGVLNETVSHSTLLCLAEGVTQ